MFSLFLYKTMRCLFDIKKCDFYKKFRFLTGSVIFRILLFYKDKFDQYVDFSYAIYVS